MTTARAISLPTLFVVVVGGMLGVAARAALTLPFGVDGHPLVLPAVTLAINLIGSLLLGILVGRLGERRPRLRAFLGTGMLGGFTTYSAFAVQSVEIFTAAPVVGILLALLSVIGGVALAAWGLRVGRGGPAMREHPEPSEDAR